MVTSGEQAPSFALPNQHGTTVELSAFAGETLVLYFYPAAGTPGCTREADAFGDQYDAFRQQDVSVVGVSTDSVSEIEQFANERSLPFDLLSDPDGTVASKYDSLHSDPPEPVAERNTFVIDPSGTIAAVFESVAPDTHPDAVLEWLTDR